MRRPARPLALAVAALAIAWFAGEASTAARERAVDPFVVAAGDIACAPPEVGSPPEERSERSCHEDATAAMFAPGGRLAGPNLRGILALGDLQYPHGRLEEFTYENDACSLVAPYGGPCSFDASWGAAAARATLADVPHYPTPGNHEYAPGADRCRLDGLTRSGEPYNACGYNAYFGDRVAAPRPGRGGDGLGSYFFRFDADRPHPILFVSLNVGQCERNRSRCAPDSPLVGFLSRTLASPELNPPAGCVVVYYHQPAWDAYDHGDISYVLPVWRAMLDPALDRTQRPDLVVNGHNHLYERYPPLDANGRAGVEGPAIPQITVGTGGRDAAQLPDSPPSSSAAPPAAVDTTHFGVEKISWSPVHGRITASFHREGDPVPFDPVTYRCRGASEPASSPPAS